MVKKEKGITIIALVVTVVLILILAVVATSMINGEDGIFSKANHAGSKYNESAEQEKEIITELLAKIEDPEQEMMFGKCFITISSQGVLTVSGIEKMVSFSIIQNNKCVDTIKSNEYIIKASIGETVDIYVIAIDENAKLYKSETRKYTPSIQRLYNIGDQYNTVTGGWKFCGNEAGNYGSVTGKEYMWFGNGGMTGTAISTINSLDLRGFSKLVVQYTGGKADSQAGWNHVGIVAAPARVATWLAVKSFEEAGTTLNTVTVDISGLTSGYVQMMSRETVKAYSVWLEP